MSLSNLIIVTGHHHSGSTLVGSHIASCRGCSLIWEPLNPTTNNYRFDYPIDKFFFNPKYHPCDPIKFRKALDRAVNFQLIQLNFSDLFRPRLLAYF